MGNEPHRMFERESEIRRFLTAAVLERYTTIFEHSEYNTLEKFKLITNESQLEALGITKRGHKRHLLILCAGLREHN